MAFNRNNMEPMCPPDCPERVPGCHDHCERFKERKLARDKRKRDYYGNPDITRYIKEKMSKSKHDAAINKRNDLSRKGRHQNP